MIFLTEPEGFNNKFDIVSCLCERDGKILILLRQDYKPQGNMWGIPAGKVDNGEELLTALERELREETGMTPPKDKFEFVTKFYTRYPEYDFIFHIFKAKIDGSAEVTINPAEHKEYKWFTTQEVLNLSNSMEDLDKCIKYCYKLA